MISGELFEVERRLEIRALAPHLTYKGLLRWFHSLELGPRDTPMTRHAVSRSGAPQEVCLRHRVVHQDMASLRFTPDGDHLPRVFIRGRQHCEWDNETIKLRCTPLDLLGRGSLIWNRKIGSTLHLIAQGSAVGGHHNPPIVTIDSYLPMTVTEAEALLLDVAPHDPALTMQDQSGEERS
jgi:hypothetical protein